jgi:hypothetical protein
MLTQLRHQFDVVNANSALGRYELLVLPDALPLDAALVRKLRAYVKRGGKLLATGTSGLNADATRLLLPELGIRPTGLSPFTTTYIRFGAAIGADVPDSDHVMYERGVRVTAARGAQALAGVVEPYFERAWNHFCSHRQTPGDRLSPYAAAVQKGACAYIAFPVFSAYAAHGNVPYRLLVAKALARLLPKPLLRVTAPTSTEATVMRQGRRTVVHLLQYCPERRARDLDIIEDIVPLHNVAVSLRLSAAPARVYLAPERRPLPCRFERGRAETLVPEVSGHAMIVFE